MEKIISLLLPAIKKFIPDRTNQLEFEIELRKLDIDDFKEKKGIITRAFHLVFPFMAFTLTVMYAVEFYLRCRQYLLVGEWITISIVPHGLEMIVIIFLSLLMPKKLLEPIVNIAIEYFKNKVKVGGDSK